MVNKRVQNAVLGCNVKNDRMISVCFQGKPFNITVIQVYATTSNAEIFESLTFESVLMRWMKLESIIQSEVSQKEKYQYSILTYIYGI